VIGRVQGNVKTQLIAHDKEVSNVISISYTPGECMVSLILQGTKEQLISNINNKDTIGVNGV